MLKDYWSFGQMDKLNLREEKDGINLKNPVKRETVPIIRSGKKISLPIWRHIPALKRHFWRLLWAVLLKLLECLCLRLRKFASNLLNLKNIQLAVAVGLLQS